MGRLGKGRFQESHIYDNMLISKYSKQFYRCNRRTAHRDSVSVAVLGLSGSQTQLPWLYGLSLEEERGVLLFPKQVKDIFPKRQMPLYVCRRRTPIRALSQGSLKISIIVHNKEQCEQHATCLS